MLYSYANAVYMHVVYQTLMKKSSSSWLRELSTSWILVAMANENNSLCTSNKPVRLLHRKVKVRTDK